MTRLFAGQEWEFVNRTTGTVTRYVLDRAGDVEGEAATPVKLRNVETDGIAQVWGSSLLRSRSTTVSHWREAR